jgi:hypothetical protein
MTTEAEQPTIRFEGGPRDGDTDTADHLAAVIGTGAEGGVYQLTDAERDGLRVYRWQPLDDASADAIIRGDIRANQG